jgi:hypothetical protein
MQWERNGTSSMSLRGRIMNTHAGAITYAVVGACA